MIIDKIQNITKKDITRLKYKTHFCEEISLFIAGFHVGIK